jgi:hypothetical protein
MQGTFDKVYFQIFLNFRFQLKKNPTMKKEFHIFLKISNSESLIFIVEKKTKMKMKKKFRRKKDKSLSA